jgi:nucleotide-binding universal stress UspA family protein
MKILSLYDGTLQSKTALQYGLRKAQEKGDELIVLQVFQSNLFVDYDAGPRAEELARAEAERHRRDAQAIITAAGGKGISVRVLLEEGDTIEEAVRAAEREQADLILAPLRYKTIVKKTNVAVYLMPGTILVPVDSSDAVKNDLETITREAKAGNSKVLLLGIIPVHLYSPAEQEELAQIQKKTGAVMKQVKKFLNEAGIEVMEVTRMGYPDEEILKVAEEYTVSLIMLPSGGKIPSELSKAAAILLEDPAVRRKRPIYLLPASAT